MSGRGPSGFSFGHVILKILLDTQMELPPGSYRRGCGDQGDVRPEIGVLEASLVCYLKP